MEGRVNRAEFDKKYIAMRQLMIDRLNGLIKNIEAKRYVFDYYPKVDFGRVWIDYPNPLGDLDNKIHIEVFLSKNIGIEDYVVNAGEVILGDPFEIVNKIFDGINVT